MKRKNIIAYFNAKGDVIMTAYGNGIMTRQLYDNRTFLLKRTRTSPYIQTGWTFADNAGVKEDKIFSFDLMGNILQTHDKCTDCGLSATPDELTRNFAYDPLYRLLNATGRESNTQSSSVIWNNPPITQVPNAQNSRAYTQAFQYDKLGNIQKLQHIGNNNFTREFDYTNANNKLNNINVGLNTYNYLYDDTGNLIKENSNRHFEWDFGNNMRCFYNQASTAEPTVYAQYLYDSTGNRVKKIVRTQGGDYESVSYINGAFEYKTEGTDEQTTTHIMDDQSRIAMIRTGDDFGDSTPAIKYNLEDYLGNSCILLETNGALINKEEYYPFGETSFGSYAKKRYKFSGKERDEESGLYYCKFRYHSAWTCRFISVDPLAPKYPYYCSYSYCGNMVITHREIEGLEPNEELNGVNLMTANPKGIYVAPNYASNNIDDFNVFDWKLQVDKTSRRWEMIGEHKGEELPTVIITAKRITEVQKIAKRSDAINNQYNIYISEAFNKGNYLRAFELTLSKYDNLANGDIGAYNVTKILNNISEFSGYFPGIGQKISTVTSIASDAMMSGLENRVGDKNASQNLTKRTINQIFNYGIGKGVDHAIGGKKGENEISKSIIKGVYGSASNNHLDTEKKK